MIKKVFFFLIFVFYSCNEKDSDSLQLDNSEFNTYIQRFVGEANQRELKGIDGETFNKAISNLEIEFRKEVDSVCGRAISSNPNDPKVLIAESCWRNRSDTDKEILIFHELGHAILRRSHTDLKLPNGDYRTIMNSSGLFGLYLPNDGKRDYYIDELFDAAGTPTPDWGN